MVKARELPDLGMPQHSGHLHGGHTEVPLPAGAPSTPQHRSPSWCLTTNLSARRGTASTHSEPPTPRGPADTGVGGAHSHCHPLPCPPEQRWGLSPCHSVRVLPADENKGVWEGKSSCCSGPAGAGLPTAVTTHGDTMTVGQGLLSHEEGPPQPQSQAQLQKTRAQAHRC